MIRKRGQVAIEATIMIGIVFFLFIGLYTIYTAKRADIIHINVILEEREDCQELATTITNIFLLGDGAKSIIKISSQARIEPIAQRIQMEDTFCTMLLSEIMSNTSVTDPFILLPGQISIENKNATVVLSNV